MPRLGVSSYAFGWAVGVPGYPVERAFAENDLLAYARRHSLRVVQIGDHVPLHQRTPDQLRQLAASARELGIEVEVGARGLTESHLVKYVEIASTVGAPLLRFVIDGPDHEPSSDWVTGLLRDALPMLRGTGLVLGVENHDRFSCRQLRRMMDAIGSDRVGICLDTANSLGAGEGLHEVLEQLAVHTVNLHVKDFAIRRVPYAMGFTVEGRPAGQGMLHVPELIHAVAASGRCHTAVLETWVPPESNLALTLQKEQQWADASIAYLKPYFTA